MKGKGKKKSKRKKTRGITKPIGRFLRWSLLALFLYLFMMNAHITVELNKPDGVDAFVKKIGWAGKVITFIREF